MLLNFIKTDSTNSVNYLAIRAANDFRTKKIETYEDYIMWVREWKELYKQLSQVIRDLRTSKNAYKASNDEKRIYNMNHAMGSKVYLGNLATTLLQSRLKNKALLKEGNFARVAEYEEA